MIHVVLLCLEVFKVSCCTHNIVVGVSQNEGCCLHLWIGKQTLCIELCIDYGVVLFVYRRSVQSMVYGGSIGSIGVFIVVFM